MKNRITYLDVLRVLSCCMIVLMHSPHPDAGVPGYVQVPLYFLTAAGLVMFFMLSGATLLNKEMAVGPFLKRRFGKVAGPWLVWTLFYMAVDANWQNLSLAEIDRLFVSVSTPGSHVMWFMFALSGLYLITPVLVPFLKMATKQEVEFYLLLWVLALAIPWLEPFTGLRMGVSSPLYYVSGYVGYFLLGYYLHNYRPNIWRLFPLFIAIPLVVKFGYYLYGRERSDELFWYLSIPVMLMTVGWFTLIYKLFDEDVDGKVSRRITKVTSGGGILWLQRVSDCCFGIYLMHIFVMRKVLWKIDFLTNGLGWGGQILTSWLITWIISFALTWAISYLPYSEYIIGFTSRKK